jgi:hypothetical protein
MQGYFSRQPLAGELLQCLQIDISKSTTTRSRYGFESQYFSTGNSLARCGETGIRSCVIAS